MTSSDQRGHNPEIPIVHGWRAASILFGMACHRMPMPPKGLYLNHAAGAAGMALFYTQSGFLIVSFLAAGARLGPFMFRRVARIVPLAWPAVLCLLT